MLSLPFLLFFATLGIGSLFTIFGGSSDSDNDSDLTDGDDTGGDDTGGGDTGGGDTGGGDTGGGDTGGGDTGGGDTGGGDTGGGDTGGGDTGGGDTGGGDTTSQGDSAIYEVTTDEDGLATHTYPDGVTVEETKVADEFGDEATLLTIYDSEGNPLYAPAYAYNSGEFIISAIEINEDTSELILFIEDSESFNDDGDFNTKVDTFTFALADVSEEFSYPSNATASGELALTNGATVEAAGEFSISPSGESSVSWSFELVDTQGNITELMTLSASGNTEINFEGYALDNGQFAIAHSEFAYDEDYNPLDASATLEFYSETGELQNSVDPIQLITDNYIAEFGAPDSAADITDFESASYDLAQASDGSLQMAAIMPVGNDADGQALWGIGVAGFDSNGSISGSPLILDGASQVPEGFAPEWTPEIMMNDDQTFTIFGYFDDLSTEGSDYFEIYRQYDLEGNVIDEGTFEYDENDEPVFTSASGGAQANAAMLLMSGEPVDMAEDGDDDADDIADDTFDLIA